MQYYPPPIIIGYSEQESDALEPTLLPLNQDFALANRTISWKVLFPEPVQRLPDPNPDMPMDVQADYLEACKVFPHSSRSSAALLRLALQKLCKHLGESGQNLNNDIASLAQKGLPSYIIQALDIVRVIGNESVHPGEMNLRDEPELASKLFVLVNDIVEDQITKKSKAADIESLYERLPKSKVDGIQNRKLRR